MLSDKIKSATKAEHVALEKVTLPLIKNSTSRSAYLQLLQVFHSFFKAMEDEMTEIEELKAVPEMAIRRKSSWLSEEIKAIEADRKTEVRPLNSKPSISSLFEALGILYVLEGSTLGGQHIVKMLRNTYPEPDHDFRFFEGYGEKTFAMWQSFLIYLNATPQEQHETVIASARKTFKQFTDHIMLHKV